MHLLDVHHHIANFICIVLHIAFEHLQYIRNFTRPFILLLIKETFFTTLELIQAPEYVCSFKKYRERIVEDFSSCSSRLQRFPPSH